MSVTLTGPADIRDQRWLDEQIDAIDGGIEAVLNIARNWTDGRNLARLHPGTSAQDYILGRVKSPLGRGVVVPLLSESNWSNRQIAAVAGVSPQTVGRIAERTVPDGTVERPAETLGADGRMRPSVRPLGPRQLSALPPPRIDPTPDPYYSKPRTVQAVVIDEPAAPPFRVIAQAFERDIRRLLEGYRSHLDDERFVARFGAVVAAIEAALEKEG